MNQKNNVYRISNHSDLLSFKRGFIPKSKVRSIDTQFEFRESASYLYLPKTMIDNLGLRPVFTGVRLGGTGLITNAILFGPVHILNTGNVLWVKSISEGEAPSMNSDLYEPVLNTAREEETFEFSKEDGNVIFKKISKVA